MPDKFDTLTLKVAFCDVNASFVLVSSDVLALITISGVALIGQVGTSYSFGSNPHWSILLM